MRLQVTEQGLLIPKEILGETEEVEVTQEQEKIIITTIKKHKSIWELGTNPVECDVKDGAMNHDHSCIINNTTMSNSNTKQEEFNQVRQDMQEAFKRAGIETREQILELIHEVKLELLKERNQYCRGQRFDSAQR
ncbi:hypothetical protein VB715_17090 [Crocosphaera sp. UHCC 0190]|uniref:hypothetical protein n=1 Tax=Crocosphaera sp. UHCC 0190 TaxID=3110246 RepID=UPI002B1E9782|nr:hypothetical protein [Crocosphaera sp. UHCC 0190]MEA5511490.1 hypothetical protein [Crocosphaera sp. UHCC 0190]